MTKTHHITSIHTSFGTRYIVCLGTERISQKLHSTLEDATEYAEYLDALAAH